MLHLTEGKTDDKIIVTLQERATLVDPFYLFVFTHATTKEVVKFSKSSADDLSDSKSRYNEFSINTAQYFGWATKGQWFYRVYESETLKMDESGLNEVENGKMNLAASEGLVFVKYDEETNYKTYAG
jgi:hypothetical protein